MKKAAAFILAFVLVLSILSTLSISVFSDETSSGISTSDDQIYYLESNPGGAAKSSKMTGDVGLIVSAIALVAVSVVVIVLKTRKRKG